MQHSRKLGWAAAALAIALLASAGLGHAAVILVTTEAGIPLDGTIDWGSLGPDYTAVNKPIAIAVTGIAGLNATVDETGQGTFYRVDQSTSWMGCFAPGEELLYTGNYFSGNSGPVVINFDALIEGFGCQIQGIMYGDFTATIEAFDAGMNSLGLFSVVGSSNPNGDDSAPFIGVLSDSGPAIARIVLDTILGVTDHDFAINEPRIAQGEAAAIPEPASMLLLGAGLLGLARARRRK